MSKSQRLIASLLTVNAILMAGLLWVQVAARPILAESAYAQRNVLPNAGAQRSQMIGILTDIKRSVEDTNKTLKSGKVQVRLAQPTNSRRK